MDVITHNHFSFSVPGDRDPEFGENGVISLFKLEHELDSDRHVKSIHVLPDERILVSAWLAFDLKGLYGLARFNPDGSLDHTFADNGLQHGNFPNGYDSAGGKLAIQADGHILMLGWSRKTDVFSPKRLVISRFDQEGAIDRSFGLQGSVIIDNSSLGDLVSDASNLQLREDGKIVVSATYFNGETTTGEIVLIDNNGNLDNSFNKNGRLQIKHPAFSETSANAVLVQQDAILVAGSARSATSETLGYVARYSHAGELDSHYGSQEMPGFSTLTIPSGTVIVHDLIDTGEGKVIGVGQASTAQRNWGLLVGLESTGNPHPAFNNGRPVLTMLDPQHGNEWVCGQLQFDGKILAAGGTRRLYVARYQADGLIDRGFGQQGGIVEDTLLVTPAGQLQVQANGRILLAGNTVGLGGATGMIYGYRG